MNLNLSSQKQLTLFASLVFFCAFNLNLSAQINFQTYSGKLATDKVQLVVFCAGWCGNCGIDDRELMVHQHVLAPGTLLSGHYLVGRVLGEGEFGITYLAIDITSKKKMAIKD
jgi:serine/threonine protein kinase